MRALQEIANNPDFIEVGRKAIEEYLVICREGRFSQPFRGNGLVIREKDGKESSVIRCGPDRALEIGLKAIGDFLDKEIKE